MKLIAHIEVIKQKVDEMADEHTMERSLWLPYSDLLNAIDAFESEVNRQVLTGEES